jgi:PadR family transcriptional regulator
MRDGICPRHGKDHPCTCAMGNIYRFMEPVLLFLLKREGGTYGYELATHLKENALTDTEIEAAAMYRTLRRLEEHGYVQSNWDVNGNGPARRVYSLTAAGAEHLEEWTQVLSNLSQSMVQLVRKVRRLDSSAAKKKMRGPARLISTHHNKRN